MNKKELSFAFSVAGKDELLNLVQPILERYKVFCLREAKQTLVMVKVREHVRQSRFYLGEVLCTACQMEVEGHKGISVLMGTDKKKAEAAAVLDAAFNAGIAEVSAIEEALRKIVEEDHKEREKRTEEVNRSKVDFTLMAE